MPRGAFFFLSIVAVDFNHDGKPDVVVQCSAARRQLVLLIEGDGAGGFASVRTIFAPPPNTAASDIVVGDFDSNNSVDLAFLAPRLRLLPRYSARSLRQWPPGFP